MARKGQIITLRQSLLLDVFKDYAVGDDWIVISGGAITVAAPVDQHHSKTYTDALKVDNRQFQQYFETTDRKGKVPVNRIASHSLAYQWNDAIRNIF